VSEEHRAPQAPKLGRGVYRSVYTVLQDDPDFQELEPMDRHVLQSLIISPDCNIARIFVQYLGPLAARTGYSEKMCRTSILRLENHGNHWIYWDEKVNLVWIRNGLKFAPDVSLNNVNHVRNIEKTLVALPKSPLIPQFCKYYGLAVPIPYPCQWVSHSHTDAYGIAIPINELELDKELDRDKRLLPAPQAKSSEENDAAFDNDIWPILGPLRKHHSRKAAKQAWRARLNQGVKHAVLVTASGNFAKAMEGRAPEHIMYAEKFLGAKGYWEAYVTGVPEEDDTTAAINRWKAGR